MSRNHIVSKVYLKGFEDKTSHKVYCTTYKLIKGSYRWLPIEPKDISQICYLIDYYEQETEEVFQLRFENKWDHFIKHLLSLNLSNNSKKHFKKDEILTASQIDLLLNFLIINYKRSPKVIEKNKNHEAVIENLKKFQESLKRSLSQDEINEFHKKVNNFFAKEPQESTKDLKNLPWLLSVNNSQTSFITTSIPVIWHDEMNGIGIYAPISPFFSILIPLIPFKEKDGIVIENINNENVNKFNKLMMEAVIRENPTASLLISNKKEILEELINY